MNIKLTLAEYFLSRGVLSVSFDSRKPNVIAPGELDFDKLKIQFSYNFPIPMRDFRLDSDGISAILSFSRSPREVYLPWESIYVMSDDMGSGMTFYEDIPDRIKNALAIKGKPVSGVHKLNPLRLIKGGLTASKIDNGPKGAA